VERRLHTHAASPMQVMKAPSKADQAAARPVRAEEPSSGAVYSFVPAHGASGAGALAGYLTGALSERFRAEGSGRSVLLADFDPQGYSVWRAAEDPRRLDGRTWGAFVSEANGHDVLDARELHPLRLRPVLDYAREHYSVICADLSGAKEAHAVNLLRASDAIFLVSSSGQPSPEMVRDKAGWLRSIDLGDRCGLLLWHTPRGASAAEAEEITGLPISSLVDSEEQIARLTAWIARPSETAARTAA
jgi:hypothetical protein